jgi:hypothetical protein
MFLSHVQGNLQDSETKNNTNGQLRISIELHVPSTSQYTTTIQQTKLDVPEQRNRQQRTKPIRNDIYRRSCIVNIRKCLGRIAFPLNRRVPRKLNRSTMENNVQHRNQIHSREHARHSIEAVRVLFLIGRNADQHEGYA